MWASGSLKLGPASSLTTEQSLHILNKLLILCFSIVIKNLSLKYIKITIIILLSIMAKCTFIILETPGNIQHKFLKFKVLVYKEQYNYLKISLRRNGS